QVAAAQRRGRRIRRRVLELRRRGGGWINARRAGLLFRRGRKRGVGAQVGASVARSGRSGRGGPSGRSGPSPYPGPTGSGRGRYPGVSGGAEGMSGASGSFAVAEDPKQYRFELVRRRLRSQLYAVEIGLSGPDVNTKPAPKPSDPPPANPGPPRGVEAIAKGTADEAPVKDIIQLVGKIVEAVENTDTDMA